MSPKLWVFRQFYSAIPRGIIKNYLCWYDKGSHMILYLVKRQLTVRLQCSVRLQPSLCLVGPTSPKLFGAAQYSVSWNDLHLRSGLPETLFGAIYDCQVLVRCWLIKSWGWFCWNFIFSCLYIRISGLLEYSFK
jgi:hypothetical protein